MLDACTIYSALQPTGEAAQLAIASSARPTMLCIPLVYTDTLWSAVCVKITQEGYLDFT